MNTKLARELTVRKTLILGISEGTIMVLKRRLLGINNTL